MKAALRSAWRRFADGLRTRRRLVALAVRWWVENNSDGIAAFLGMSLFMFFFIGALCGIIAVLRK